MTTGSRGFKIGLAWALWSSECPRAQQSVPITFARRGAPPTTRGISIQHSNTAAGMPVLCQV